MVRCPTCNNEMNKGKYQYKAGDRVYETYYCEKCRKIIRKYTDA